jgi:hypothetical protein
MVAALGGACADDPDRPLAGDATVDAPPTADSGPGQSDGGQEFGAISGQCGVLDDEIGSAAPARLVSRFAFDHLYTEADLDLLTAGGREIIADGNAGGSSLLSEVFAFELLSRCELAALLKTETEIVYDVEGKKTDLLVDIDGAKIGVSVTRAVAFPFDAPYTEAQAEALLDDKLSDILQSTANVSAGDRWTKQILAVLAYGPGHADSLAAAYATLDPGVLADSVVWVIVTDGADDFIYCDGACP